MSDLKNEYIKLISFNTGSVPIVYNHKARFVNDVNYNIYRRNS